MNANNTVTVIPADQLQVGDKLVKLHELRTIERLETKPNGDIWATGTLYSRSGQPIHWHERYTRQPGFSKRWWVAKVAVD